MRREPTAPSRRLRRLPPGGLAASLALAIAAAPLAAQTEDPPKVAVVLSGGGALGSAHVGVLQVLEEEHVPIDLVVGSSIGAVVGGLYASGTSADEMERLMIETDWRALLDHRPERRRLPFREKVDDLTLLAHFEEGFNRGRPQIPPGLFTGHKLALALQAMAPGSLGIDDFDDLPIPFRAVAADAETWQPVVIGDGNLARALRASISIPGLLSPVEIDGRRLVDGSLGANLPIDVARALGADVVIAVDVGQALTPGDEPAPSLFAVAGQDDDAATRGADLLIRPDVGDFSPSQFDAAALIVPRGREAGQAAAGVLRRWAVPAERYAARLAGLRANAAIGEAPIRSIAVAPSSVPEDESILPGLRLRSGDPLDLTAIEADLDRLIHRGRYERVDAFLARDDGGYELEIEVVEKSWGPNLIRGGLDLVADSDGEVSFDLLLGYRMTEVNRSGGEVRLQSRISGDPTVIGELYQPLGPSSRWFLALRGLRQPGRRIPVPVRGDAAEVYEATSSEVGLDLGLALGRWGELRVGVGWARAEAESDGDTPVDVISAIDADLGAITLSAVIDQLDDVRFPRRGYFARAVYEDVRADLGGDLDYETLSLVGLGALSAGRHTVSASTSLHTALGSESPVVRTLGGLFALSGNEAESITGRYGGVVTLVYRYHLADLPQVAGGGVYVGGSLEAGDLWMDSAEVDLDSLRSSASLFSAIDTRLGPVYLAAGISDQSKTALSLVVGRTF